MARKLKLLQVGKIDYRNIVNYPENILWEFLEISEIEKWVKRKAIEKKSKRFLEKYDVMIFLDKSIDVNNIDLLSPYVEPYRVFYNELYNPSDEINYFLSRKMASKITLEGFKNLIEILAESYYGSQSYGERRTLDHVIVSPSFLGNISYKGNRYIELEGEFGEKFKHLALWRYNINQYEGKPIEFWPEFYVEGDCSIEFVFRTVAEGSISEIISEYSYVQDELNKPIIINEKSSNYISVSVRAKGKGTVNLGTLHVRETRLGAGEFLPGGKRIVDSNREELIYYFHPGDLKPPLNVYFSGYRGVEGFEGYFFMEKFKAPFILISDPRLEGGAFYRGSENIENELIKVINKHLSILGFTNNQLILSGLSMGTYGALYYGAKLQPSTILIGKPLANLGDIALNGLLVRPREFETGLDILRLITGECTKESAYRLNRDFWREFNKADFSRTRLAIAYMKNDDYDDKAYYDILDNLSESKAKIISKGILGRHNDNTEAIIDWFVNQFEDILKNDFGRD